MDRFDLERFVRAQAPVYEAVRAELAAGRKRTHWMWFVFPQLRGMGMSSMAQHYGIASLEEARAYLAHPLLGARLRECCALLLGVEGRSAHEIMGSPDDVKLRSCATLFALAAPKEGLFADLLAKFYGAAADERTLAMLGEPGLPPRPTAPRS